MLPGGSECSQSNMVPAVSPTALQAMNNILTPLLSANALGLFAPVFTIVLYAALAALRGDVMDAETAFTSVALLLMITRAFQAYKFFTWVFLNTLGHTQKAQCGLWSPSTPCVS